MKIGIDVDGFSATPLWLSIASSPDGTRPRVVRRIHEGAVRRCMANAKIVETSGGPYHRAGVKPRLMLI